MRAVSSDSSRLSTASLSASALSGSVIVQVSPCFSRRSAPCSLWMRIALRDERSKGIGRSLLSSPRPASPFFPAPSLISRR